MLQQVQLLLEGTILLIFTTNGGKEEGILLTRLQRPTETTWSWILSQARHYQLPAGGIKTPTDLLLPEFLIVQFTSSISEEINGKSW